MSEAVSNFRRPEKNGIAASFPVMILGPLLGLAILLAVQAGAVNIAAQDWLAPLRSDSGQQLSGGAYVLWSLRLPRIAFAIVTGAALGLAGSLTQGLFRNPLADPGIIGVASGAACAAALTIVILAQFGFGVPPEWRYWLLPVTAFGGAVLVCFMLDRVARWLAADSTAGLLLAGVAFNALAGAVIGFATFLATDEQLRSLSFWMLGSLAGASWTLSAVFALLLLLALMRLNRISNAMNALALGEASARHIGIDIRRLRMHIIVLVALLCGFAVAWCGMIGFVGLAAPHLARMLFGPDQRLVAPLSMWIGAILLLLADTLARSVAIPAEVPVGVFTSLIGFPFFMLILSRSRRLV